MDQEKIMPLIVLWIVWVVAVSNLRRHFHSRKMTAHRPRRGGEDDSPFDAPSSYPTTPSEHPISYWALLTFYSFSAVFVPAVTLYLFL